MNKNLLMYPIGIIGLYLLWLVDWKVALGGFLLLWANNIGKFMK